MAKNKTYRVELRVREDDGLAFTHVDVVSARSRTTAKLRAAQMLNGKHPTRVLEIVGHDAEELKR